MNRLITLITLLIALHPLPGSAAEKGKIAPPSELTQMTREGEPLDTGAETKTTSLTLSGTTWNCSKNACAWDYSLEIELRPIEEAFTGYPTHRSPSLKRRRTDCREASHPPTTVAGLAHGTAYKWQAREKVVNYKASYAKKKLACKKPKTDYSPWEAHGEEGTPSFVIAPLVVKETKSPTTVAKIVGSGSRGKASSLNLNDENYYRVWATPQSPYMASWYATFKGLGEGARNLEVSYKGFNSQRCDQSIRIWDWKIKEWTGLDSQEVGKEETLIEGLVPPGEISNYVSGAGEVRIHVQCSGTAYSFNANGNLLNISYDQPLSPR